MDKLVLQAKQGNQDAIEQLVSNYKGLIRSLANKFFLVGGDKDDLLQEGMLGLFCAINSYDENKGAFPSFVALCVSRQIVDAVKRDCSQKNKPLYNYVDISAAENFVHPCDPLQNLLQKEYARKLAQVIAQQLSPLEQKVLTLFAQGYAYEDIAKITGKTFKAVDGALQRARRKLLLIKE